MTSLEMLEKYRNDGSYERTIADLMDDGVRKKISARHCMKALVRLQQHYIDKGFQGDEPEFQMLRVAIGNLSEGDLQIIPMGVSSDPAGWCSRGGAHDGPCNGYPRILCPQWGAPTNDKPTLQQTSPEATAGEQGGKEE